LKLPVCILLAFLGLNSIAQETSWQQHLEYHIEVKLDDQRHFLRGEEQITYSNHSPDTLHFLIFHLWPNAYASKRSAMAKQLVRIGQTEMLFATDDEMGFIDSLAFSLDGQPCVWEYDVTHRDICTLKLERPLHPGEQVLVHTPFRVKLPDGKISRLGHIDQSYQITQWYPKPAVYDRNGWHGMPYLSLGEFYSEFGTYDVKITLPKNYLVGATGDLQNAEELKMLDRLAKETKWWIDKVEKEGSWDEIKSENHFPDSDAELKTLHYKQDQVHDFAWFADKRFHVLKGSVELPHSKQSVNVWTMFTNKHADLWANSLEYMHDAVYYYSLWNGDYPYQQATAVDGTISAGGGMEYPNVTVIGTVQSAFSLETVIMHEVGHNWFYGILGSNERRYPWLDEGLNSYNEQRYMTTKYPNGKFFVGEHENRISRLLGFDRYPSRDVHYFTYLLSARYNMDQAIDLHSEDFSMLNYGAMVYSKTAIWFDYLRHYKGDEWMDSLMHAYFEAYKFKHPQPEDIRSLFEADSKSFGWLFDQGIGGTGKLDYGLKKVRVVDGATSVELVNRGSVEGPVCVSLLAGGDTVETRWVEGFLGSHTVEFQSEADQVSIDYLEIMPEIRRSNNHWHKKGLFGKFEPLQIKFLGQLEDPRRTELYVLPVVGWNVASGWMPGIALYNSVIPIKKLNWAIMPMMTTRWNQYSNQPDIVGAFEAYYALTPSGSLFETIDLGARGRRFVYDHAWSYNASRQSDGVYHRIEPYARLNFRPFKPNGLWDSELMLSQVRIFENPPKGSPSALAAQWESYTRLAYHVRWNHPAYKTGFKLGGEQYKDFIRVSFEVLNHADLDDLVRIRSRIFFGVFASNNATDPRYNFRMEGQRGRNDYAYDGLLLDRGLQDPSLSQQLFESHGAFKVPTAVGSSNAGILAYNLEVFSPKFPVGLFADFGTTMDGTTLADAGLCMTGKQRLIGLYVPLWYTSNIDAEIKANGRTFKDLIRIQLSLNLANPFELRKHLKL
jgi:hypothetical protein